MYNDIISIYNSKMFVNEEKGVVVCVIETNYGTFKGRANCSPKDIFNKSVGKKIAYQRALRQLNSYAIKVLKEAIIQPAEKAVVEYKNKMTKSANIIKAELDKLAPID